MAAKRKNPVQHIAGSEFALDQSTPHAGVAQPIRVWVGLTEDCPVAQIDVGSLSFVKVTAKQVKNPGDPRKTVSQFLHGGIGYLDPGKLDDFKDRLRRTVVRLHEKPAKTQDGVGENVGDPIERASRGRVIKIPSETEVLARREKGLPDRRYERKPQDQPAARYCYLVVCEDQSSGMPENYIPEPILTTGLRLPGDPIAESSAPDPEPASALTA